MAKKVSGFGYGTNHLGHKYVSIFKEDDGNYYVEIDRLRSRKSFSSLDDIPAIWECVDEVEGYLNEIHENLKKHTLS
jgi:hypothetical protein